MNHPCDTMCSIRSIRKRYPFVAILAFMACNLPFPDPRYPKYFTRIRIVLQAIQILRKICASHLGSPQMARQGVASSG